MRIALLHTGQIHVATFDALLDASGYTGARSHIVRQDLLDRAREDGLDSVREETAAVFAELADADSLLCTCSTLGPLTDAAAGRLPNVVRVDRPMMETAAALGPNTCLAICLQSTEQPSLDLLNSCAAAKGLTLTPRVLLCADAWPFFESGDLDTFAARIAAQITAELAAGPRPDCVVLAQASMRVAEPLLADLGVPVLTSPALAVERALEIAKGG